MCTETDSEGVFLRVHAHAHTHTRTHTRTPDLESTLMFAVAVLGFPSGAGLHPLGHRTQLHRWSPAEQVSKG